MTVHLRDMSDFDTNEDVTGFAGVTHKATEGTTVTHQQYARRLNRYYSMGIPVLGAYHVVRTPGSGGNGSLSSQLDFWLSTLDRTTPWWRTHPHFILQIDLERWPYDAVTLPNPADNQHAAVRAALPADILAQLVTARSSTGMTFAQMLVASGVPGWKVTYASRGQYGNNLTGIATPLWNAAYRSSTYPGDGSADWAPYSGKTPILWQYTSTPFDKNAFRGSLNDLLDMIGGSDTVTNDEFNLLWAAAWLSQRVAEDSDTITVPAHPGTGYSGYTVTNAAKTARKQLATAVAALQAGTAPTQDQVNTAVAAVMNDPAWIAKMAEANAAALVQHVKVV